MGDRLPEAQADGNAVLLPEYCERSGLGEAAMFSTVKEVVEAFHAGRISKEALRHATALSMLGLPEDVAVSVYHTPDGMYNWWSLEHIKELAAQPLVPGPALQKLAEEQGVAAPTALPYLALLAIGKAKRS